MNNSEESTSALHSRDTQDDDQETLVQTPFLALDIVLRIIAYLPSLTLFNCRCLCQATHSLALRTLAHRPFFVLQKDPPSPLCSLLPLDLPCSPLPCSFELAKPSFRLLLASGNLLCLRRQYALLLDICVCNIFRKWKTVVPPIVLPSFAPHIQRRVFLEDINVESLRVVGFHAVQPTTETHEEDEAYSPVYRIFVASTTYLRVFDSHVNQWSGPVYFPSHLRATRRESLVGFATSDGNLILTLYSKVAVFNYEDQSFHAMNLGFHPSFEVAGYLASAEVGFDPSFNLKIRLHNVQEQVCNSPQGLVLEGSCKNDVDSPYYGAFEVCIDGVVHVHEYSRRLIRSFCHAYKGKLYALMMERDEMRCFTESTEHNAHRDPTFDHYPTSTKFEGKEWHDLPSIDVEKCLNPDEGATFDCAHFFPACSSDRLMLYSACLDTTNWTLKVSKEADATASLNIFNIKEGTLSFISS